MKFSKFTLLSFLCLTFLLANCEGNRESRSEGFRISDRNQLIGGHTALGEVGDYMLQNDQIRIIVQDKTFNRGSGIFGGSLIDADLRHPGDEGGPLGGNGNDTFGEMFPAFFLEMIDPDKVEVIADGSDGKAAIIEVTGTGGEFITMIRYLNQLLLGSHKEPSDLLKGILKGTPPDSDTGANLQFSTRYILEPHARHVRIESTMTNISLRTIEMPPEQVLSVLKSVGNIDLGNFRLPLGHILGFGALSKPFLPGLGFDIRQGLVDELAVPVALPGFPGKLTPLVASTNTHGVNYGFIFEEEDENNFVYATDQDSGVYQNRAKKDDMLYLFNASGFGGVFSARAPKALAPSFCADETEDNPEHACLDAFGPCDDDLCSAKIKDCIKAWAQCRKSNKELSEKYTFTNYFILGTGDVSSIYDEMYKIRKVKTSTIHGEVRDEVTNQRVGKHESVLVYSNLNSSCDDATIISQIFTFENGQFELELPNGKYCFQTAGEGRPTGKRVALNIKGASRQLNLVAKSQAKLIASVTDESGELIPFKVTLVGTHEDFAGKQAKEVLVDLPTGDPWRPTDVIKDDPSNENTRQFIEEMAYSEGAGPATVIARPGKYKAYISRGMEYEIDIIDVDLVAGQTLNISGMLKHAIDTTGYLSGDFHIHAAGSIDSGLNNNLRVKSIAGEGVEVAVSTEHNYITDLQPYVLRNDLQNFMTSTVGIELTTFEAGHFNGFPVNYDVEKMSRGSVRWQGIGPDRIFDAMRGMYDGKNIVQVNHPRTPILGYFAQHNLNPFDTTITLPFLEEGAGLTATLASPNGPAFYTTVETPKGKFEYRSTFSWEFDAIEVFGGHHIEELRHYRMPYDKSAPPNAPNALPAQVRTDLRTGILADFFDGETENVEELNDQLATFLSTEQMPITKEDIEKMTKAVRDKTIDDYVESRIPKENDVLCNGNSVLHAGTVDDWYNLLNHQRPDGSYKKYTATGNSDTHDNRFDEAGVPRNFFWAGDETVQSYKEEMLVKALDDHHNIVTNGPFVWFTVNKQEIGSELEATGEVSITIHIEAAKWVSPNRFRLIANGEPVKNLESNQDNGFWGWIPLSLNENNTFETTYSVPIKKDTWFTVEVEGDQSLFPIVSPQDIPPFNFSDVVGSLAGAFGVGGDIPGLGPDFVFPVTPFALTNPIWVVADGDGEFTPPNPPVLKCNEGVLVPNANIVYDQDAIRAAKEGRLKPGMIPKFKTQRHPFSRPKGENRDVRIIFEAFGGHSH